MNSQRTIGRLVTIGIFLTLLVLPMVQMAHPLVTLIALNENRVRAAAPGWRELAHPSKYSTNVQNWFRDNYGFRDLLIQVQTQIEYSLFDTSDRLHIGHDGWLFYRSVIDHEEPQIEALTDADLDQLVANFARLRDWLSSRGIHLIVITNQGKDRFYPELLPYTARRAIGRHRFSDFLQRMHRLPDITLIDTTPKLLKLKEERRIFHKTDFHWNDPAAFVIAGDLVDTIAALEYRPLPFWHYKLAMWKYNFSGGQAIFLPLFHPLREQALMVYPNWPKEPPASAEKPFEAVTHLADNNLLPPTVVFGDSFFEGIMRSGLANYFQYLAFARRNNAPLETVLSDLPPDTKYFIVQFFESALVTFRDISVPNQH